MLYQLSYCPRVGSPAYQRSLVGHPDESASLLVHRVLAVVAAVLAHLETLTVVDLRLHRDVVTPLALGALEGDLHPLVGLGHLIRSLRSLGPAGRRLQFVPKPPTGGFCVLVTDTTCARAVDGSGDTPRRILFRGQPIT